MNLSKQQNMGLNLPMLLANSQNLDNWNAVGQFSPPIGDRSHLRVPVPLPMPFPASSHEPSGSGGAAASRNIFGTSSSDLTASPQKPMDTEGGGDDKDDPKRELTTPSSSTRDGLHSRNGMGMGEAGGGGGGGGLGAGSNGPTRTAAGADAGSSPIPNTNTLEGRPTHHEQDDLDIKQELVDYFHAPHPPAPPDSHRSYSSTDDNRLGGMGGADSDDYAQDLRVSAAAAAAAKNLDFSQFVLPRNLRRSSESLDEKFSPLNMRKLGGAGNSSATTTAGQMLMNSLLSNESMSEDTPTSSVRLKSGSQDAASTSAAAAAAALYAESLNKDDCDFIGSNVTHKLRSMDRTQRIIAEKLISEVLFYGQFNELERTARIQPK